MFPHQTEPEALAPPGGHGPGQGGDHPGHLGNAALLHSRSDTFKHGWIPPGKEGCYTCRHEIILRPCDQLTVPPGTKHWFQAPDPGAVFYSIFTCCGDALDGFTDASVVRRTCIVDDPIAS